MVDSHYLGYELSWEDSVLDVVDNFIHRVFQRTVENFVNSYGGSHEQKKKEPPFDLHFNSFEIRSLQPTLTNFSYTAPALTHSDPGVPFVAVVLLAG